MPKRARSASGFKITHPDYKYLIALVLYCRIVGPIGGF